MHKLLEFVCDEIDELERKADKEGKLSMSELQYLDTLAHTKKNLLTADAMMEGGAYEDGSYEGGHGGSYARGGNRTRYNRGGNRYGVSRYDGYSRADDMMDELRELMEKAPNEQTRKEIERVMRKLETM